MIGRSAAPTSASFRYTDERGNASNRHCWNIGSAGFMRSTIARRSARLSCRAFVPKNHFRPSTGRSAVQMIDLGLIAGSLRRTTTLEDACRTVRQLLLPVVDLVRVDPELPSQLGDGPVALMATNATFALNDVLCFFLLRFMSCSRAIRA